MKKIPFIALALLASTLCHAAETPAPSGKDWVIETQADWEECAPASEGVEFRDAMAVPTAPSATIRSKIKTFDQKQSARSLVVSQSPVWDNWTAVPKIAPASLGDAPVLLTVGPGNYWIFGRYSNKRPDKDFTPQEAKLEDINSAPIPYLNPTPELQVDCDFHRSVAGWFYKTEESFSCQDHWCSRSC